MDLSETDPGRSFRRRARIGAMLSVLATVLPFDRSILWAEVLNIFKVATNQMPQPTGGRIMVIVFCCFGATAMLSGFCGFAIFTRGALKQDRIATLPNTAAVMFLLFTLLPAFCFFIIHLSHKAGSNENAIAIGLGILMAYLFAGGITFLNSWHKRGTPLFIFWLLAIPLVITNLAWLCLMFHILFNYFMLSGLIVITVGLIGSLMMLTGWLGWWSAVKTALAQPSTSVAEPRSVA